MVEVVRLISNSWNGTMQNRFYFFVLFHCHIINLNIWSIRSEKRILFRKSNALSMYGTQRFISFLKKLDFKHALLDKIKMCYFCNMFFASIFVALLTTNIQTILHIWHVPNVFHFSLLVFEDSRLAIYRFWFTVWMYLYSFR